LMRVPSSETRRSSPPMWLIKDKSFSVPKS
jgi:hypothetical protein